MVRFVFQTRRLLAGLLLSVLAVSAIAGCATASKHPKPPVAAAPPPPAQHIPELVGTITLVNAPLNFVLVDVGAVDYPAVGVALKSFSDGKETGILMVSPEKNRPFIIADIVKGTPAKGDLVYQ